MLFFFACVSFVHFADALPPEKKLRNLLPMDPFLVRSPSPPGESTLSRGGLMESSSGTFNLRSLNSSTPCILSNSST